VHTSDNHRTSPSLHKMSIQIKRNIKKFKFKIQFIQNAFETFLLKNFKKLLYAQNTVGKIFQCIIDGPSARILHFQTLGYSFIHIRHFFITMYSIIVFNVVAPQQMVPKTITFHKIIRTFRALIRLAKFIVYIHVFLHFYGVRQYFSTKFTFITTFSAMLFLEVAVQAVGAVKVGGARN
jgi:hypothetical protein